jgi:hypothetical protein
MLGSSWPTTYMALDGCPHQLSERQGEPFMASRLALRGMGRQAGSPQGRIGNTGRKRRVGGYSRRSQERSAQILYSVIAVADGY